MKRHEFGQITNFDIGTRLAVSQIAHVVVSVQRKGDWVSKFLFVTVVVGLVSSFGWSHTARSQTEDKTAESEPQEDQLLDQFFLDLHMVFKNRTTFRGKRLTKRDFAKIADVSEELISALTLAPDATNRRTTCTPQSLLAIIKAVGHFELVDRLPSYQSLIDNLNIGYYDESNYFFEALANHYSGLLGPSDRLLEIGTDVQLLLFGADFGSSQVSDLHIQSEDYRLHRELFHQYALEQGWSQSSPDRLRVLGADLSQSVDGETVLHVHLGVSSIDHHRREGPIEIDVHLRNRAASRLLKLAVARTPHGFPPSIKREGNSFRLFR